MNAKEIKKLYKLIDSRSSEMIQEILEKKEDDLADLSNHPGWKVLRELMEDMLCELFVPIKIEEAGSAEILGIVTEARAGRIDLIQKILSIVETTKVAKDYLKEQKNGSEDNSAGESK